VAHQEIVQTLASAVFINLQRFDLGRLRGWIALYNVFH
jgi:hypothetical protein